MIDFPNSKTYEDLSIYSPWNLTLRNIVNFVKQNQYLNTKVLDLMCGTGLLLNKIKNERPDLILFGVDNNEDFIIYAKNNYPNIEFSVNDVFSINEEEKFDLIICSGGTHHLKDEIKIDFLYLIKRLLNKNGVAVIADPYISDYDSEVKRKISAAQLGYEYLLYSIKNKANAAVINECIAIMENDINRLEYKASITKFKPILEKVFKSFQVNKSWPSIESEFGDYYIVCQK